MERKMRSNIAADRMFKKQLSGNLGAFHFLGSLLVNLTMGAVCSSET
jgi:hypothetical protein